MREKLEIFEFSFFFKFCTIMMTYYFNDELAYLRLVLNSVKCVNFFQDTNMSEPGQKYPHMPKINPGNLPVSSINSVHINIYSGVRVIASRILHDIFLLLGELHFMMSSSSKTDNFLQTTIYSILDQ